MGGGMSTLIEKLEREYQKWCELEDKSKFGSGEAIDARGRTRGLLSAIEVAKQYSDWISVDERLPEPNKLVLVAIHRPQYYVPDFMYITTADYDEVRKKWSSINLVDDLHNVVYWQPFPVIPKPPSEVKP